MSKGYEENLKRIEAIVAQLERGDLPLEASLTLFEEGVALVKTSSELLDKAEQKVFTLLQNETGAFEAQPTELSE